MPLFLDVHKHVRGLTREGVTRAHRADVKTQAGYDVEYLNYWHNEKTGDVFCLVRAPNRDAAIAVHREAHGLLADELIEVVEGT